MEAIKIWEDTERIREERKRAAMEGEASVAAAQARREREEALTRMEVMRVEMEMERMQRARDAPPPPPPPPAAAPPVAARGDLGAGPSAPKSPRSPLSPQSPKRARRSGLPLSFGKSRRRTPAREAESDTDLSDASESDAWEYNKGGRDGKDSDDSDGDSDGSDGEGPAYSQSVPSQLGTPRTTRSRGPAEEALITFTDRVTFRRILKVHLPLHVQYNRRDKNYFVEGRLEIGNDMKALSSDESFPTWQAASQKRDELLLALGVHQIVPPKPEALARCPAL